MGLVTFDGYNSGRAYSLLWFWYRKKQSIRLKYSSTQTIQFSSAPGEYNKILRLDDVATMLQWGGDVNSVEMVLSESTPLVVDNPEANKVYGGQVVVTEGGGGGSWETRDLAIFTGSKRFLFNRFDSRNNIVELAGRKFNITLQNIRDKSTSTQKLIEYTFAISEE